MSTERRVYLTVNEPKYKYVEVTEQGDRGISLLMFGEDDYVREHLGYSLIDLVGVVECWATNPLPQKQGSRANTKRRCRRSTAD